MRARGQSRRCQRRLEFPNAVAADVIAFVGGFRSFAVGVRDEKLRCRAEAAVVARVSFVVAQIENVAVSPVPIVEIGTILEPVRIETSVFLVQTANRVRAGQKAKRTR